MITLTRLDGEPILINALQIQSVESVPESRLTMMNGTMFLVKEPAPAIAVTASAWIAACLASRQERGLP